MTKVTITIYHNPRCSKSRATLDLLRERGIEPRVVEYLKAPPSPDELRSILGMLGFSARQLLRSAEAKAAGLDPSLDEQRLIEAMTANPSVIERDRGGGRTGADRPASGEGAGNRVSSGSRPVDPQHGAAHLTRVTKRMQKGTRMMRPSIVAGSLWPRWGAPPHSSSPIPRAVLTPTPRQTAGPFYPLSLPLDADADLASVSGRAEPARGVITHILGRVLDGNGRAMSGARVEVWQCDALGRYHHPLDGRGADLSFQGYGATVADREGAYHFRTIRPVAYPGRAPHIHFALQGLGFDRFTTQMYVAGEPLNDGDVVLSRIRDPAARRRAIVSLEPDDAVETGALLGHFDIVIGQA